MEGLLSSAGAGGDAAPHSPFRCSPMVASSPPDPPEDSVRFSTGIPPSSALFGSIRLFRDAAGLSSSTSSSNRSPLVCVVAVPLRMALGELCSFIGPHLAAVASVAVLRDVRAATGSYMALIRFRSQAAADDFFTAYNGRLFASFDNQVCHVVYVADVKSDGKALPAVATDTPEVVGESAGGVVELPTCPVCLERLDTSISGMLTTVCNHSFHCTCLTRWEDSSCPVCRYCQGEEDEGAKPVCDVCGRCDNLWMCLICGHVGCGRYDGEHAVAHYSATQHAYSMELKSQRVWDYAGDGYVHRLIANSRDGKLVEFPDPRASSSSTTAAGAERSQVPPLTDAVESEMVVQKMERLSFEFGLLLSSQLEQQREYYEAMLNDIRRVTSAESEALREAFDRTQSELAAVTEKLTASERERKAAVKRAKECSDKLDGLTSELTFTKDLNASLTADQTGWKKQVSDVERRLSAVIAEKERTILDLQEQVQDLMFMVEQQTKVAALPEAAQAELRGGSLVLTASPTAGAGKAAGKRKGAKK